MNTTTIYDHETGKTITRDFDENDKIAHQNCVDEAAAQKTAQAARDAAKLSAQNKLAELGLTPDEIAAL